MHTKSGWGIKLVTGHLKYITVTNIILLRNLKQFRVSLKTGTLEFHISDHINHPGYQLQELNSRMHICAWHPISDGMVLTTVRLRIQVLWDVMLFHCMSGSRHFEEHQEPLPNDTASHPRRTDIWLEIPVSLTQLIFSNTTAINTVHCNSFIIRMLLCLALANIMTT